MYSGHCYGVFSWVSLPNIKSWNRNNDPCASRRSFPTFRTRKIWNICSLCKLLFFFGFRQVYLFVYLSYVVRWTLNNETQGFFSSPNHSWKVFLVVIRNMKDIKFIRWNKSMRKRRIDGVCFWFSVKLSWRLKTSLFRIPKFQVAKYFKPQNEWNKSGGVFFPLETW